MNVIGLYQHPILSNFIELLDEIISQDEYPLSIGALSQEILNSSQSILYINNINIYIDFLIQLFVNKSLKRQ